jgi:SulP family sulfate permease
VLIVDFSAVPFLDSTGAHVMEGLAHKTARRGVALYVTGANADIRRALLTHGVKPPAALFAASPAEALSRFRAEALA